jgi:thiamine transport system ATP-binding protein
MLDEPLGALDRTHRDELVGELSSLFSTLGITVLYVTHDQSEALALADRVVVMSDGGIVRQGSPQEVWRDPGSAFVARFLGFTNLFDLGVVDGAATAPWGPVHVDDAGIDGRLTVLVRPDAVRLVEPGAAGSAAATVGRQLFRGERSRLSLRLGDGSVLEIDRPTAEAVVPDLGDRVGVVVDEVEVLGAIEGGSAVSSRDYGRDA